MKEDVSYYRGMLAGYLIATNAPPEIRAAVEVVWERRPEPRHEVSGPIVTPAEIKVLLNRPVEEDVDDIPEPSTAAEPPVWKAGRGGRASAIPDSDADIVRQLIEQGKTDEQIGREYECSAGTVSGFRKKHSIPGGRKGRRGNPQNIRAAFQPSPPPGEVTTYTDEDGRTIKKCPPGYAIGVSPARSVGAKGYAG